jgi:hypothetical protein
MSDGVMETPGHLDQWAHISRLELKHQEVLKQGNASAVEEVEKVLIEVILQNRRLR